MSKEEEDDEALNGSCEKEPDLTPGLSTVAVHVFVGFLVLVCSS